MAEQSITISFCSEVSEEGQSLVMDLDEEENDEKTQFLYGTKAFFRVFKFPYTLSVELFKSDGTLAGEGSGTADIEETITFANTDTASISKPGASLVSYSWLGNSLGSVSIEGGTVKSSKVGVGVLRLVFRAPFDRHSVTLGEKEDIDEYPVIIFALGTAGE